MSLVARMDADTTGGASGVTDRKETTPMLTLSRWIRNLVQEFAVVDAHQARDSEPPIIRQRLTRYTSS